MTDPIPLDHDTIVCHPDDAGIFAQFAGIMKIVKVPELERGKSYTMKAPSSRLSDYPPTFDRLPYIPRIEHGPRFAPESNRHRQIRTILKMLLIANGPRCRSVRAIARLQLDPNYRHPKRISK